MFGEWVYFDFVAGGGGSSGISGRHGGDLDCFMRRENMNGH